ncbi:MAG: hypothetical protein ACYDAR_08960 [Thermomicrobiales bacterium]
MQFRRFLRAAPRALALVAPLLASTLVVPWMAGSGGGVSHVDAASPNPYIERTLLPNPLPQPGFNSIALSSDSSTAVVGNLQRIGAVAVYGRSGSTYRQIGNTLTDPSAPGMDIDAFGQSVGVSSDGTMVVIGNPLRGVVPPAPGMVYVYTKSGNAYVELGGAPIATGDATYKSIGTQVAISGDGATVVMSATNSTTGQPVVLVYTKGGGVYTRQQVLTGGTSFALSTDGTTIAIGADGGGTPPGSVSVYVRSGGTYSPFGGTLIASDGTNNNRFGGLLALSGNGATLAIAAINSTLHPQQSVVYVFTKGVSSYSQGQEILTVVGSLAVSQYGGGLALNGDGTVLALGVTHDPALDQTVVTPTVNVYIKSGGTYAPFQNGLLAFPAPSVYGRLLALNGDGSTLVVGLIGGLPATIFSNTTIAGVGVWRNTTWSLNNTLTTIPDADLTFTYSYGSPNIPLLCDWSGTNAKQPGLFGSGGWVIGGGLTSFSFGQPGDIPVCGDWTGQGKQTIGVFRGGVFYLKNSNASSNTADIVVQFGTTGDIPVVGDWTGQGKQTVGVYRNGVFYLLNNNVSSASADIVVGFGQAGDLPVVGDWTGGGIESIGVFRNGSWYLRNTNTTGAADTFFLFGTTGDVPLVRSERLNGVAGPGIQPRVAPTAVRGTPTATRTTTATPVKGSPTPNPLPPHR